MDDYVGLLEDSFHSANNRIGTDAMGSLFFDKFFSIYPETQQYFNGTDINYFKGKKLNIIFTFITDIIKHPNYAEVHISQEVMRHQMYGLKDKTYYFTLIDCLFMVVKETLNDEWNPEYETAWHDTTQAFKAIVGEAAEAYL
ncbi:MAG: hypothetical protein HRU20_05955 [Pseudomonadales bacterium]|nr:hypothetical protein [Pseudomonadales bacterium]